MYIHVCIYEEKYNKCRKRIYQTDKGNFSSLNNEQKLEFGDIGLENKTGMRQERKRETFSLLHEFISFLSNLKRDIRL